jgi:hypothetical protein
LTGAIGFYLAGGSPRRGRTLATVARDPDAVVPSSDFITSSADSDGFFAAAVISSDLRLFSRSITRRQDAAHSRLLMCVPESQKPMQSWNVSPPPPGVLGADRLGLTLVAPIGAIVAGEPPPPLPGKVAVTPAPGVVVVSPLGVVVVIVVPPGVVVVIPPLPRKVEVVGGDSGAMGATCGAGVPIADGGSAPGVVVGLGGGAARELPEVNPPPVTEPLLNDDLGEKLDAAPPRPPPWAAAYWGKAATSRPTVAAARAVERILDMVPPPAAGGAPMGNV